MGNVIYHKYTSVNTCSSEPIASAVYLQIHSCRFSLRERRANQASAHSVQALVSPIFPLPGGCFAISVLTRPLQIWCLNHRYFFLSRPMNLKPKFHATLDLPWLAIDIRHSVCPRPFIPGTFRRLVNFRHPFLRSNGHPPYSLSKMRLANVIPVNQLMFLATRVLVSNDVHNPSTSADHHADGPCSCPNYQRIGMHHDFRHILLAISVGEFRFQ